MFKGIKNKFLPEPIKFSPDLPLLRSEEVYFIYEKKRVELNFQLASKSLEVERTYF